jgi:nitroreductase
MERPEIEILDRALSTTRAVRRRLDLERDVPISVVLECLRLAVQAPTGGGREGWQWIVVKDPSQRAALAELYRRAGLQRFKRLAATSKDASSRRIYGSAAYLAENLARVPVQVVPCIAGRLDRESYSNLGAAGMYGSILPAIWSFQLALQARGLGTCLTTGHLEYEAEAAELLGIPDGYTQIALLPIAYTTGEASTPRKGARSSKSRTSTRGGGGRRRNRSAGRDASRGPGPRPRRVEALRFLKLQSRAHLNRRQIGPQLGRWRAGHCLDAKKPAASRARCTGSDSAGFLPWHGKPRLCQPPVPCRRCSRGHCQKPCQGRPARSASTRAIQSYIATCRHFRRADARTRTGDPFITRNR